MRGVTLDLIFPEKAKPVFGIDNSSKFPKWVKILQKFVALSFFFNFVVPTWGERDMKGTETPTHPFSKGFPKRTLLSGKGWNCLISGNQWLLLQAILTFNSFMPPPLHNSRWTIVKISFENIKRKNWRISLYNNIRSVFFTSRRHTGWARTSCSWPGCRGAPETPSLTCTASTRLPTPPRLLLTASSLSPFIQEILPFTSVHNKKPSPNLLVPLFFHWYVLYHAINPQKEGILSSFHHSFSFLHQN